MSFRSAEAPFSHSDWVFEAKWDGYRGLVIVDQSVHVFTRNQNDYTRHFPELQILRDLVKTPAVLDGELCALDDDGRPVFEEVMSRDIRRAFVVFDVLRVGNEEVMHRPLEERHAILDTLLPDDHEHVIRSRTTSDGLGLFSQCEAHKIEGIVAKRRGSRYRPGFRTDAWLKIKTQYGKQLMRERAERFAQAR